MGEHTDNYPYGDFPLPPGTDWHEPMTVLSAIAGATENIRLATGILISPLRNAALLAKIAATLDCVSNGRLDLGVGTGWQKEEYDACGLSFKNRIGQLEDQLRAMQLLWCQAPASFSSDTVNFDRIYCNPFPIQEGGIPLWMGMAPGPRALSLLAECCVGWVPMPMSLEELKPKIVPISIEHWIICRRALMQGLPMFSFSLACLSVVEINYLNISRKLLREDLSGYCL
jgi:alkanesulfonate monooxygenase SsuD/methylene tetrahydromethanopterin reductase-like flavin-dependent oxidoreductase (luciferase family)